MLRSLRSRLILASLLWTGGMLMLMHIFMMVFVHVMPRFGRHETGMPSLIGAAVMISGFWWARRSLVPLLQLPGKVAAVRKGDDKQIEGVYPSEVQPLIDSVNALLEDREKAIKRAYATAGDLAHGLKTPLALLTREAELAGAAGNQELAEKILQQVQRMTNQVDYNLARARVAAAGSAEAARCAVAPCAEALIRTVSKLYAERGLELTATVPAEVNARVRVEDLEEILGNLLDNACKWAKSKVALNVVPEGSRLTLFVEDDGPGLPDALSAAVLERGVRLDEAAPGSGLGLAIVRDLAEHYGGSITLGRSPLGGLQARISLPAA